MRSLLSVLSRTGTRTTPLRPASSILRTALNRTGTAAGPDSLCTRCLRRTNNTTQLRFYNNNQFNDDQRWLSVVDAPSQVVRTGRKHGPGLILLGAPYPSHRPQPQTKTKLTYIQCSTHPHNLLRPRNMANPTSRVENQPNCQIRRPTNQAPTASTPADRPVRDLRVRLPSGRRDGHTPT